MAATAGMAATVAATGGGNGGGGNGGNGGGGNGGGGNGGGGNGGGGNEKTFTFTATGGNGNGGGGGGGGQQPTPLTVSFERGSYTVAEGNSVTVTVTLSDDPERTVTIPITRMDQDGASSDDYSGVPDDVVFDSGDTEKTFTFTATDDTEDDDGESVKLTFGTLPDTPVTVTAGTTDETVISITDDDPPTSLTVNFERGSYTVTEGNSVTVTVTLSDDPERTVTIPITRMDQDGASSDDYSGVLDDVVFDSGDTEKTFTFTATDDTEDDDGESVKLTFGTLPDTPVTVAAGTTDETVISITDDDPPTSLTVNFERGSYTVTEGNSVTVTVTLSDDPERTVTIPITRMDQDGASSDDYSGVLDDVVFDSGDTEKTFTFTATDDTEDDDGESVKLTFGTLPDTPVTVAAGTTDETVISITDDDPPTSLTVNFERGSYTVTEGNSVTVTVTLSDDPERTVTIPITRMDQDGASSDDYSGVLDDVVFDSGDTEKTFTFTATDDTEDDDGESVKLTFGTLPDTPVTVAAGTTDETVISITDDDPPTSLTVNFERGSYTVTEGNSVTVTVTLSDDPERTVTIPITRMDQDGASSDDYSGVPDDVVFNSGDTEKTFTFTATDDTEDDDDESVKLTFGTLPDTPVTVTARKPPTKPSSPSPMTTGRPL